MGQALLSGFKDGFGMMERHNARVGRQDRLARLDEQNEDRYQDSQGRLSDMDDRNEDRYQDGLTRQANQDKNTADYRNSMLDQSTSRTENQQSHYQWQKNEAEEKKQWSLHAPLMQNGHNEFFKTGKLPERLSKFFVDYPEYNDYNPETYRNPEYRKSAKMLRDKTHEIFKGKKLHEFKDPAYIKLFSDAFQSKIQQGVGEVDVPRNAKVTGKEVAQLIPTRDGKVSIGLKVTYQGADGNAYTEIQPMTKGRTSDQEDPVNEWELKELLSAIETRASMADMAENGEHYQNRSKNTLKGMGFGKKEQKSAWKEVKGDMGQTLGYQNLTDGTFQKLNEGADVAAMDSDEKAEHKQQAAQQHTQTYVSAASEISGSMNLDLNDDDLQTVVQMFETQARSAGPDTDLNKLMTDMLTAHAQNKTKSAEQRKYAQEHSADNILNRQSKGLF